VVVLLLGALFALGKLGSSNNGPTSPRTPAAATTPRTSTATRTSAASPGTMAPATPSRATARTVSLQIVPTAPVYVCLTASGNRRLVDKATLTPGSPSPTFRSTRFLVSLGNTQVRLRVSGRTRTLAASSTPVGYEITRGHVRRVPDSRRPTCGA
jgi:hypothetical protein